MGTVSVHTDALVEQALAYLTENGRTRAEAIRYAVLRTYRAEIVKRANADVQRLEADPHDRAEMLEIQRFMGIAE